jgi:acetoin utilization deacetylase AcuC-like enzyme
VHDARYVEELEALAAAGGGHLDADTVVVPDSARAARTTAGCGLVAIERLRAGEGDAAFVVARPPGHHANRARGRGFCLFNNVAIAAAELVAARERVLIVDWDVHHGNGTQDVFYDDGSVLFVSLHQDGLYPADTGTLAERGSGPGDGTTVNIPLPAGTGDDGYRLAFARVVEPVLRRFEPQFLLVSAGQDAAASDPLGRMSVTTEGFRALAAGARSLADELCDGRLVAVHEGGYSVDHVPLCNLAILEALAGLPPTWERDPMELDVPTTVSDATRDAIEAAARAAGVA